MNQARKRLDQARAQFHKASFKLASIQRELRGRDAQHRANSSAEASAALSAALRTAQARYRQAEKACEEEEACCEVIGEELEAAQCSVNELRKTKSERKKEAERQRAKRKVPPPRKSGRVDDEEPRKFEESKKFEESEKVNTRSGNVSAGAAQAWTQKVYAMPVDTSNASDFPIPPTMVCSSIQCKRDRHLRHLDACPHALQSLFEEVLDVKAVRNKMHPDRFCKVDESLRANFQKMAEEIFVPADAVVKANVY